MKFGRTLRDETLKEWRFYAVDYKELKKSLKLPPLADDENEGFFPTDGSDNEGSPSANVNFADFFSILDNSKVKLGKFYADREKWALDYIKILETRVEDLRNAAAPSSPASPKSMCSSQPGSSLSNSCCSLDSNSSENNVLSSASPTGVIENLEAAAAKMSTAKDKVVVDYAWLKEEYRKVEKSKHFHAFIYAKKSLKTFERELDLLVEFLGLNATAFAKILKKFDKRTGSSIRETQLAELEKSHGFMSGKVLLVLKERVCELIEEVHSFKPKLPEGWENRKVYTIGCFDLFHQGHENVLVALREFGYYVVAGIHDDASYFQLKNKYTIENLETRMKNVKPFVDQLYVIPSTDPLLYIQSVVSEKDIETGACCYARGDDMLDFPSRDWVESVMPVHFVPRTEACSSTLLRTIYHSANKELGAKAAFAKTRYDGKPIDEDGNVLP
jgi:cytidyltransferase-like protein